MNPLRSLTSPHSTSRLRSGLCRKAIVLCVTLLFACGEQYPGEAAQFRQAKIAIANQYPGATVTLEDLNVREVVISVFNSSVNDKPDEERIAEARRSSRTAVGILTAHPPEEILVIYVTRTKRFGIPVTRNIAHYRFAAAEFR